MEWGGRAEKSVVSPKFSEKKKLIQRHRQIVFGKGKGNS